MTTIGQASRSIEGQGSAGLSMETGEVGMDGKGLGERLGDCTDSSTTSSILGLLLQAETIQH